MSATSGRERVVHKYDPRGVLCAAFAWGVLLGVSAIPWIENLFDRLAPASIGRATMICLSLVISCYAVYPLLLARMTRSFKLFICAAVLTNAGIVIAGASRGLIRSVGFGAGSAEVLVHPAMVIALLFTSAIAVSVALVSRWMFGSLRYVPTEQTVPARLCWACGYEAGEADPCPECGRARAEAQPRGAWVDARWRLAQRAGRPLLVTIALCSVGYAAWRVSVDYLPTRRFVERFDTGGSTAYAYVDADQIHLRIPLPHSVGQTIDLNDGTERMILVSYHPRPPEGLAAMQVRICAPATLPPGWPADAVRMTDWGLPSTVVADLNREHAERVIREGLPRGLIDAIVAKADEIGWKPGGGMQNVGGTRIVIDAKPCFADNPMRSDADFR